MQKKRNYLSTLLINGELYSKVKRNYIRKLIDDFNNFDYDEWYEHESNIYVEIKSDITKALCGSKDEIIKNKKLQQISMLFSNILKEFKIIEDINKAINEYENMLEEEKNVD